ncbi:MAG TPA: YXWGXW repeat-containing protein [Acetobacteraceae bacterium]|jgi:hypothetical protein|nr:YXWGXW repeat-containing protein [Acetobacteraceae bacterium]
MMRRALLAACLPFGLAGCVVATPVASYPPASYPPVPAARAEIVPPAPAPGYVWIRGHWRWNGARYVWIGGHYLARPVAVTGWVPAHWANRAGRWVWVPGHWA